MTEQNRDKSVVSKPLDEAVERLVHAVPAELFEALAKDVLQGHDRVKKRIARARKEINDGARPKEGRFSL